MPNTPHKVRDTGFTDAAFSRQMYPKRAVFTTSTGTALMVVMDTNDAGAAVGQGTRDGADACYVYESTDRITWTLKVTYILPGQNIQTPDGIGGLWCADLYSDNSIGVAFLNNSNNWHFFKIAYSTWTVSIATAQFLAGGATFTYYDCDLSISETNAVVFICSGVNNTANGNFAYVHEWIKATDAAAWWNRASTQFGSGSNPNTRSKTVVCSVQCLKGGTAAARRYARCIAYTNTDADHCKADVIEVNEAGPGVGTFIVTDTWAEGDVQSSITHSYKPRVVYCFAMADGSAVFAQITHRNRMEVRRYSGANLTTMQSDRLTSGQAILTSYHMAMSFGTDTVNIYAVAKVENLNSPTVINWLARCLSTGVTLSGHYKWNNLKTDLNHYPWGGGGRNAFQSKMHDMAIMQKVSTTAYDLFHHFAWNDTAPAAVTPSAGASLVSSTPGLSANADLNIAWPQSKTKIVWQIASDAAFTTNVKTYTQDDAKFTTVLNTHLAGVTVKFTDTLSSALSLTQGSWFVRAAHINQFGLQGPWTASQTFTVSHPPAATNLTPNDLQILQFGTTGTVQFSWKFTDPYSGDTQSAYQVVVTRNSDGTIVYDSGKVMSSAASHTANMPAAEKDKDLAWTVALWDSGNVQGVFAPAEIFQIVDPPTVVIDKPTANQVVVSAIPDILFTPTVGGNRTIDQYRVTITKGSVTVHDSNWVNMNPPVGTGVQIAYYPGNNVYANTSSYTVKVQVRDSYDLEGLATQAITTSWTPPAAPTGQVATEQYFNVENDGYVLLSWDDLARDVDFISYIVYRKVDEIDPTTLAVLVDGVWEEAYRTYDSQPVYDFLDYYAPSGYKVNYRVKQLVDRFGDQIESENTTFITVYPMSEGYWLIEPESPDRSADAFRLSFVTGDSYTDEYEEEEFSIIGRGRHVDQGEHLGVKGTLDVQIRDSIGFTARQKKRRLEDIKKEARDLQMRTPFGDLYKVHVGSMQVGRLAGVGRSEFVDVSIPYSEVGD